MGGTSFIFKSARVYSRLWIHSTFQKVPWFRLISTRCLLVYLLRSMKKFGNLWEKKIEIFKIFAFSVRNTFPNMLDKTMKNISARELGKNEKYGGGSWRLKGRDWIVLQLVFPSEHHRQEGRAENLAHRKIHGVPSPRLVIKHHPFQWSMQPSWVYRSHGDLHRHGLAQGNYKSEFRIASLYERC